MGKTVKVDFERARKRRQFLQSAKRFAILGLVTAAVVGAIILNNFLVDQGVSTHVSDIIESFGGDGFPIDLPGGIIRDTKSLGKNLTVLNDTNLYIYSPKARLISNIQQMTENTVLCANAGRVLTYDTGSKRYRIHSPSKLLAEKETEDSILAADLGTHNEYALVTSPSRFVAMVTVYNEKFEPVFYTYSAENHITGVSLSPAGDAMVTSAVNTDNGMLRSYVAYYRFNVEDEIARVTFDDSLILQMDFISEDRVGILTDRTYTITDQKGKELFSYALGDNPITAFASYGKEALIRTEYKEARRCDVVLLGAEGEEIWTLQLTNNVRDMCMDGKLVYILDDGGISVYDRNRERVSRLDLRGVSRIHLVGDTLYYFTQDEIKVLEG
ncbi:MAG: DUF5711 family protein [Oscillospiraceae bacterium]|jgi:hypothetical protein|nr:DUF5711 family protein [Oscillospiraceae bacterium]